MELGKLFGGKYVLRWVANKNRSLKNEFGLGGEKIDHRDKKKDSRPYATCYKCTECQKLIIDY